MAIHFLFLFLEFDNLWVEECLEQCYCGSCLHADRRSFSSNGFSSDADLFWINY